jgi:hypothetical protein
MRRFVGCLLSPRLLLLVAWLTNYTDAAYMHAGRTWLLVLGFLFLPLTALAWALIVHFGHDASRWWPAALTVIALFELGILARWFRGEKGKKKKRDK